MTNDLSFFLFALLVLLGAFEIFRAYGEKKEKEERKDKNIAPFAEQVYYGFEKDADAKILSLRNGFKVTRDKNPTIGEQWVNIMNYNGESQTEEEYEEKEDNSTKHLE